MSMVFYITNRCAIPTAASRVYNVQRIHVFNVASLTSPLEMPSAAPRARLYLPCAHRPSVYPPDELWERCGVKLVVSYRVCPAGRP
jgi:hypothetical protein